MRWWDRKNRERVWAWFILGAIAVAWTTLILGLAWALTK